PGVREGLPGDQRRAARHPGGQSVRAARAVRAQWIRRESSADLDRLHGGAILRGDAGRHRPRLPGGDEVARARTDLDVMRPQQGDSWRGRSGTTTKGWAGRAPPLRARAKKANPKPPPK